MSGIAFLKIIKGIQKTPADSLSAEQGLDEIDLLDANGFSCDDYDMKIPALKSSAVYADSPLTDGRTLISGVLGNVTETIRCNLTAGTIIQMAAILSKLLRFKQDCNDFWDTSNQIEPIYIKHQVIGEPGSRYALLYDIDVDIDTPLEPDAPQRTVTIVIEREYGWRALAPGDNPKKWTAYKRNETFNADYADLSSSGVHLASDTNLLNGNEYQTSESFLNKNMLTIPAASVDGDLPALALITTYATPGTLGLFIARDTRPATMPSTNTGTAQLRRLDIIAGAASLGTGAAFVADTTGLAYVPVSATRRRIDVTFTTPADTIRASWNPEADLNALRGRYALFARIRQYNGAQGDLRYYVKFATELTHTFWTSPVMTPTLQGTSGSVGFALDYLGVVDLPPRSRAIMQLAGKGLLVSGAADPVDTENQLSVRLSASRVSGTTAILAISDFLLMPIDEAACKMVTDEALLAFDAPIIVDNTGYLGHGSTETNVDGRLTSGGRDLSFNVELHGNGITLQPGVENRLIVLTDTGATGSTPNYEMDLYVDIVPRWSGLRDV